MTATALVAAALGIVVGVDIGGLGGGGGVLTVPALVYVLGQDAHGSIKATANYVLMQVLFDRPDAKLHQVGVYRDVFRRESGQLKLA